MKWTESRGFTTVDRLAGADIVHAFRDACRDDAAREGTVAKPVSQTGSAPEFPALANNSWGAGAAPEAGDASEQTARDLTKATGCVEDGVHSEMKLGRLTAGCLSVVVLAALGMLASAHATQAPGAKTPVPASDQTSRVTIEVSGGENAAPVENASVYIKYVEERKIKKDKKVELNVKTNREGTAHVPDAPLGRVLIQVVADGWKTYGRWYDIAEAKQIIKVHLERPPRWY
jgi:hypothetical protein